MSDLTKGILIATVIAVIVFFQVFPLGIGFITLRKAQAIPVVSIADVPRWIQYWLDKLYSYTKDSLWPILRDLAAKKITDYITQQTLDWINNGQEPTFVSNWNQFSKDVGNIAFDSVNNYLKTNGVDLCSPFVPQIQIMLQGTFIPSQPISCSIDNFLENISNSTDMLKRGDWLSYSQVIMPENNPMGLYLISENRIYNEYMSQKEARTNEALSSSGFLGQKTCAKYNEGTSEDTIAQSCAGSQDVNGCVVFYTQQSCVSWDVQTPGDVAGKAVANVITSDTNWGANIQSFTSAIINALINKLFQSGLSHLKGSSATSEYVSTPNPITISQFNGMKQQIGGYYDDVIYYFDSSDYPTLQIWKDVQSLAQQGATGTTSCTLVDEWTAKYDQTTQIVNGIQSMLDEARANLDELDNLDPSALTAEELAQKVQDVSDKYNSFQTNYQSLVGDVEQAKQNGDITETQKLGIDEKNNLTQALSTAPDCGSPNVTP
jgi:hypothetical protein